jgi:hypothetical protein
MELGQSMKLGGAVSALALPMVWTRLTILIGYYGQGGYSIVIR